MSTHEERRARAEDLLRRARRVRPGSLLARKLIAEADVVLAELRRAGYHQLPDGSWANASGQVVGR